MKKNLKGFEIEQLSRISYVFISTRGGIPKPFQNKKCQRNFPGAPFLVSFSQLPAVKNTESCAPWEFFWLFLVCDGFRIDLVDKKER